MLVKVKDQSDVMSRKDAIKRPFADLHERWREIEAFRKVDIPKCEELIWKGISKANRRWTIIKSDVAAIDHTTVSFLQGDGISVNAEPKDTASARLSDTANIIERLGLGVWDWLDRQRAVSMQQEMIISSVARGHICAQYGWLSPDERGERRVTVQPQETFNIPGFEEINQPRQSITTQGRSPVFVQVLDPIDCYWNLGKHDRVLEVVHEFRATYLQLCDLYPDLPQDGRFNAYNTPQSYDRQLTVVDYWNEQVNAILIENQQYKAPTVHGYGRCPFVIELVNPQLDRDPNNGATAYWGTPFCLPILEHVKALSWADSISATYMEEIAFALLQHKGIRTQGPRSPHIVINPDTKEPEYAAEFDFSPDGRVKPMYDGESLEYLQPPRLVDMLQEFKAARMRDIQLLTYAEGILTGVYNLDISGLSVAQQKQAAMARLTPYITGCNRAASRLMTAVFELFPQEWDRVGPFLIDLLVDGVTQSVPVTREMFASVRKVTVELKPKVPINPEAEMRHMLSGLQSNVYSIKHVMERSGVQDPNAEMMQIAFERMVFEPGSPYMEAMAREMFKQKGYTAPPDPSVTQTPQMPMGGAPPGMGAPVAGGMPQQAMAAPPPMAGGPPMGAPVGGGLPPEYMALLQQLPPEMQQQVMSMFQQDPQGTLQVLDQVMAQMGGGGQMALGPGGPPMGQMAPAGMMA